MAYNYNKVRGEYVEVVESTPATSNLKTIGHVFSAASTDEVIINMPATGKIGIVYLVAEVASGLTSPTVTIKDGTTRIAKWAVPSGDAKTLISSAVPLEIDGDLVAQVNDTGITLSAWVLAN
ncbi:hypothetical protein [Terrihalobacillus insolitus]|uniref:hypothetical protein n=1 Tax=Terrihalobacillus insolitus TaxID=2950438 RepID=UPI002340CB61|nr:hypothetical protein [Terrihalobacillus insolitus]MDC3412536.1 hypothetical protein [Terrihalobacillus insolitus]